MIGNERIGQYWVSLCYLKLADGVVRVTCGEGDYCIGYRFSQDVFVKAIAKLGVGRVAELGIKRLLSKDKSGFGGYVAGIAEIDGWFLNTHSGTQEKIRRLRKIAA